ncbi:T-complex protein 1 delta subunit, partial [Cardiosporidium cionae]
MAAATVNGLGRQANKNKEGVFSRNEKQQQVRFQNIIAAKAVADAIRTSLGPKGMDKMIQDSKGGVVVTNDGATILNEISVVHPTGRMLVELSKAQDIEAGDGTTSVVVIAGALLTASEHLLDRGIHPQSIADGFLVAAKQACSILKGMSIPVDLSDRDALIKNAATSLNSKVVSQSASLLAPMAVDAVLKVIDPATATSVDLNDIRIVKKLGGTVDDSELVEGLVFSQQRVVRKVSGAPTRVQNAKIGLVQFCLAPPKTDMDNSITIKDYQSMDRLLREERLILAKMIKQIAATGCNVLLIQKSILHDAVTELSLDYLAKAKILVVKDIERDDIEFISRTCGCEPVASIDQFSTVKLGHADLVYDEDIGGGERIVRFTGVQAQNTVSLLVRSSNLLVLDESERSLHDALCVVRSLVKT